MRGDSALGIPGLLNVARAGRVVVANALGSGLLSSGALMGFLPAICRKLLGEELAMPSVGTWWCGEPALDYVRENFDDLVIKPAYPTQRMDPVFGYELKGEARVEMLRRLEARPHAYVAQRWSTCPAGADLEPFARAPFARPAGWPARLRSRFARRLFGDAGRSGPRCHRGQRPHHFHAARWFLERCLGTDRWAGQ